VQRVRRGHPFTWRRATLAVVCVWSALSSGLYACGDSEREPSRRVVVTPAADSRSSAGAAPYVRPSDPGVWTTHPASECSEARIERWPGAHRFAVHAGHVLTAGPAGASEWDLRAGRERLLSTAALSVSGVEADATHLYLWSGSPIQRGRDSIRRLDLATRAITFVADGLSGLRLGRLFADAGHLYWMDTDPSVGAAHVMRVPSVGGVPESVRSLPRSMFKLGLSMEGHLVLHSAFEADYLAAPGSQRPPLDALGDQEASTDGFYELRRDGYPREVIFRPMRGPTRVIGSVPLAGSLSFAADAETVVVAYEDAFLGELHLLPTGGGPARRIGHRLVLPQGPVLVDGCLFFLQGSVDASETVFYTRVHPPRGLVEGAPP